MSERLLTQADIEKEIMRLSDALEEETYRYANVSDSAAEAEAEYKLVHARATIKVADENRGDRQVTVNEREALAHSAASDQFRRSNVQAAAAKASREHLLSLRSRLDALRTLAANVRHLT